MTALKSLVPQGRLELPRLSTRVSKTRMATITSPGQFVVVVVVVGIDPTSSPYEGGTHPSTSHNQNIGVSYRYRSGTTAFTEQGAGHYTKDTI